MVEDKIMKFETLRDRMRVVTEIETVERELTDFMRKAIPDRVYHYNVPQKTKTAELEDVHEILLDGEGTSYDNKGKASNSHNEIAKMFQFIEPLFAVWNIKQSEIEEDLKILKEKLTLLARSEKSDILELFKKKYAIILNQHNRFLAEEKIFFLGDLMGMVRFQREMLIPFQETIDNLCEEIVNDVLNRMLDVKFRKEQLKEIKKTLPELGLERFDSDSISYNFDFSVQGIIDTVKRIESLIEDYEKELKEPTVEIKTKKPKIWT